MPAQSPTLSPTLSAMTAGLRGSSSGMPASTLPTRSAPTSAPFVKIAAAQPREDGNQARPEGQARAAASTWRESDVGAAGQHAGRTGPHPSSPRPTTSMPVIAPPLNATSSAGPMPLVAACAVRTLARTDTFMPMKPQAPDSTAPSTKPAAVRLVEEDEDQHREHDADDRNRLVLPRQICRRTLLDRTGDLLHARIAGVLRAGSSCVARSRKSTAAKPHASAAHTARWWWSWSELLVGSI